MKFNQFFSLLLLFCTFYRSLGDAILDLYGNATTTQNLASSWIVYVASRASKTFMCNDTALVGIYNEPISNVFASTVYTSVPSHTMIIYRIEFILVNSWSLDNLYIFFDNVNVTLWPFNSDYFLDQQCGQKSLKFSIYGQSFHTGSRINLVINTSLSVGTTAVTSAWGVREIGLIFTNKSSSDVEMVCGNGPYIFGVVCACSDGQYRDENGICQSCHFACTACSGPSAGDCFGCGGEYVFYQGKCGYDSCPVGMTVPAGYNTQDRICVSCQEHCDDCSENLNSCKNCTLGYYFNPANSKCETTCPTSYWKNNDTRVCVACSDNCVECSATVCYSCSSDTYYPYSNICLSYPDSLKNFINGFSITLLVFIFLGYVLFNVAGLLSVSYKVTTFFSMMGYAFRLIDLGQQLSYLELLNVIYPEHIISFVSHFKGARLQWFSGSLNGGSIPDQIGPSELAAKGISINFLSTASSPLILFVIFLVMFVVMIIVSRKAEYHHVKHFAWAYLYSFLYIIFMDLSLACFLQFQQITFKTTITAVGTVMAFIFFIILSGFTIFVQLFVCKNAANAPNRDFRLKYGMLYENCKFKRLITRSFIVVTLAKKMAIASCIAFGYSFPMLQAFMFYTIQLLYLIYVLLARPFTVKRENLILCVNEIIMMIIYVLPFAVEAARLGAQNVGGIVVSVGWLMVIFMAIVVIYHMVLVGLELNNALKRRQTPDPDDEELVNPTPKPRKFNIKRPMKSLQKADPNSSKAALNELELSVHDRKAE